MTRYLIRKKHILQASIKGLRDPNILYPFDNISLETTKDVDVKNIVLMEKKAIIQLNTLLKDSKFNIVYTMDVNGPKLPTEPELDNLYHTSGIDVKDLNGNPVRLGATGAGRIQPKNLDGILIDTTSNLIEVAGFVAGSWKLDNSGSTFSDDITDLLNRMSIVEAKVSTNETAITDNHTNISKNANKLVKHRDKIATNKINIHANDTDIMGILHEVGSLQRRKVISDNGGSDINFGGNTKTLITKEFLDPKLKPLINQVHNLMTTNPSLINQNTGRIATLEAAISKVENVWKGDIPFQADNDFSQVQGSQGLFDFTKDNVLEGSYKDNQGVYHGKLVIGDANFSIVGDVKLKVETNGHMLAELVSGATGTLADRHIVLAVQKTKASSGGGSITRTEFENLKSVVNTKQDHEVPSLTTTAKMVNLAIDELKNNQSDTLQNAKNYTDQEIGTINNHKQDKVDNALSDPYTKNVVGAINNNYNNTTTNQAHIGVVENLKVVDDRKLKDLSHSNNDRIILKKDFTENSYKLINNDQTSHADAHFGKRYPGHAFLFEGATGKISQADKTTANITWACEKPSGWVNIATNGTGNEGTTICSDCSNGCYINARSTGDCQIGSTKPLAAGKRRDLIDGPYSARFINIIMAANKGWRDITSSYQTRTWTADDAGKRVRITLDRGDKSLAVYICGQLTISGDKNKAGFNAPNLSYYSRTLCWNSKDDGASVVVCVDMTNGNTLEKINITKFEIWE